MRSGHSLSIPKGDVLLLQIIEIRHQIVILIASQILRRIGGLHTFHIYDDNIPFPLSCVLNLNRGWGYVFFVVYFRICKFRTHKVRHFQHLIGIQIHRLRQKNANQQDCYMVNTSKHVPPFASHPPVLRLFFFRFMLYRFSLYIVLPLRFILPNFSPSHSSEQNHVRQNKQQYDNRRFN